MRLYRFKFVAVGLRVAAFALGRTLREPDGQQAKRRGILSPSPSADRQLRPSKFANRASVMSVFAGLALVVLMVGCAPASPATFTSTLSEEPSTSAVGSTDSAARYEVTVDGGFGSGSYPPGATVHVWSAVSTTNGVAQRWRGDVDLLAEPDEWRTTFVMPARDVSLAANSSTQTLLLKTETFNGVTGVAKTVRYHFPPQMRGVVLFSHGTGGSSAFVESTEAFPIALALVADGYGVMSIDAEEAAAGDLNGDGKQRWFSQASAANIDLGNLEVLFDSFEARRLISAETPKFALGMSAGGNFSHLLGTIAATPAAASFPQLRFAAVVSFCADATASKSSSLSTTPSAWYMCAAEDNPEVSNTEARANEAQLRRRGIATDYAEHAPSPLYDERFTRIDGIDVTTSAAMAAELRAAGFTDGAGFITRATDDITSVVLADPGSFPTIVANPRVNQVRLQIRVMRAEHAMFADLTRRTIDFLDRFNPNTPCCLNEVTVTGAGSVRVTVAQSSGDDVPTSFEVTASPGGGTCTVVGESGSCDFSGLDERAVYTFTAVAINAGGSSPPSRASVSVTPGSGDAARAATQFGDVSAGVYYARGVDMLFQHGITTGKGSPNVFAPDEVVTRAQMATFLWRMAGEPSASACSFTDQSEIPTSARVATCWLKDNEYTTEYPYNPFGVVTRAQMATFLFRIWGPADGVYRESCGFNDEEEIPSWARSASCWSKDNSITVGYGTAGGYVPDKAVTRGQMAAFLYRLGGNIEDRWLVIV